MSELLLPVTERLLTPGGLGLEDLPGLLGSWPVLVSTRRICISRTR